MNPVQTLVIDNFRGDTTIYKDGNINSGRSWIQTSAGANPFVKPGQLTWNNAPVLIDPNASVITDLILAGKERVENGVLYVYAIGHTGRLYKIQVNDPTTYNPNYDNPVLIATLTAQSPTFTRGASMDFFGTTEQIWIGHDKGVTRINFNGSSETFVGVLGSWTQNVPRPMEQFVGKLYIANGDNLAEVDNTTTVTTYTKLSPSFPKGTQVRDIDTDPSGTYLQAVVSRIPLPDILATSQNADATASSESYVFKWNGTDAGYTSFNTFPTFSLTSNITYGPYEYNFGYDQFGLAMYAPLEKVVALPEGESPLPNAVTSLGNIVAYITPVYFDGVQEADLLFWGRYDFEVGNPGTWDVIFFNANPPETDVVLTPFLLPVSNTGLGSSTNGYANNVYSFSKMYFSALEKSAAPTTTYRLYKWNPISTPDTPALNPQIDAYYQTQAQMFSKKVQIKEVRVYGEPWEDGVAFNIDLWGSGSSPIHTQSLSVGTTLTEGDDYAWYNPECAPTYTISVGIEQKGTTNHTIDKIEIDYAIGGK